MMERYTLDEYAQMMRENKPYLIYLEELVSNIEYGQLELTLDVRARAVEKLVVTSHKTWLRPKNGHAVTE